MNPRVRVIDALYSMIVASTIVSGCSASGSEAAPPVTVRDVSDTNAFTVAHPEQFPIVTVATQAVSDHLRLTSVVSPDVNRTVPVNALGSGRVVEIRAKLGDDVQRGQPLVVIASPDMAAAVSDYQKARADADLARMQYERAQTLFQHDVMARKDFEIADNADRDAAATLRAAEERIRLLGGDPAHPSSSIALKAPISGTIVAQNTAPAAGVKSPDTAPDLFTIADLSHVWLVCDVHEEDLGKVTVGARAIVHLDAFPDRSFSGTVANISKVLDPSTRTAAMRVELANPHGIMRQGMFATVDVIAPHSQPRVVLPTTAVLRLHDADWVFVKTRDRHFRRTLVQTGAVLTDGDSLQTVLSGIAAGTAVVRNALAFSHAIEQQ